MRKRALPCVMRPHSLLPSSLYLDHSHCLVLAPATLAALPSTRAIPDRDVFHVAHPIRSIVSRLRPQRSTATSRLYQPCRSSHFLRSIHVNGLFLSRSACPLRMAHLHSDMERFDVHVASKSARSSSKAQISSAFWNQVRRGEGVRSFH